MHILLKKFNSLLRIRQLLIFIFYNIVRSNCLPLQKLISAAFLFVFYFILFCFIYFIYFYFILIYHILFFNFILKFPTIRHELVDEAQNSRGGKFVKTIRNQFLFVSSFVFGFVCFVLSFFCFFVFGFQKPSLFLYKLSHSQSIFFSFIKILIRNCSLSF